MIVCGVTGGSGSGKSRVCRIFREMGYPVLDTDRLVHSMYAAGELPGRLAAVFGKEILSTDGSVDRRVLGKIVFADREKLCLLNRIVHKEVREYFLDWAKRQAEAGTSLALVDAPQLFEAGMEKDVDAVIAVIAPETDRVHRILTRDHILEEVALARIRAQHSEDFFRENAGYLIENPDGTTEETLRQQIAALIHQLIPNHKEDIQMTEEATKLKETLLMKKEGAYAFMNEQEKAEMEVYAKGYMAFLDAAKTEREAVRRGIAMVESEGFVPYTLGQPVKVGGKYYYNNRGKALYVFAIGEEPLEEGIRISAAHIDSPRLDLKPCPLYESDSFAYFKTHYYGGIRKYQWVTIPLSLHGTVVKKDGEQVDICIGEKDDDPVFYITDLLPHLAKDQNGRPLGQAIPGEKLNVLVGASPLEGADADGAKLQAMKLLNDAYGITEADFMSAELSFVPAFKSREIGFDRALIGGYGHDDRVCAYPALTAMLGAVSGGTKHTVMAILADKEEVGSGGNTGMQSGVFLDIIEELSKSLGANFNIVKANSACLSADVNAGFDPDFGEVYEKRNASTVGGGVVLTKYTGSGGKSGTNDASAEFIGKVRRIFDGERVLWQVGELGKVDQGGGGTVAIYISTKNIDVVDLGVPVLSMHAPWECISKADLLMTHKAFLAFNLK